MRPLPGQPPRPLRPGRDPDAGDSRPTTPDLGHRARRAAPCDARPASSLQSPPRSGAPPFPARLSAAAPLWAEPRHHGCSWPRRRLPGPPGDRLPLLATPPARPDPDESPPQAQPPQRPRAGATDSSFLSRVMDSTTRAGRARQRLAQGRRPRGRGRDHPFGVASNVRAAARSSAPTRPWSKIRTDPPRFCPSSTGGHARRSSGTPAAASPGRTSETDDDIRLDERHQPRIGGIAAPRSEPVEQVRHGRDVPAPAAPGRACRGRSAPPRSPGGSSRRRRGCPSTTGARSRACRSAFRAMAARSGAPPLPARRSAADAVGVAEPARRGSSPPPAPPWSAWRSPRAPAAPPAP